MTRPIAKERISIVAAFAAIYVLWGSTYLAVALALQSMPPFLLMSTRSVIGGAVLLAIAKLTGNPTGGWRAVALAIPCGVLFFVGCHGVLAYAQQRVPSGLAALLLATIPLWIALLQTVLRADNRPDLRTLTLLVPGIGGVGVIAWHEIHAGSAALQLSDIVLLLGASASWALGTLFSERNTSEASPVAFSAMELIAGGIVLYFISMTLGELPAFSLGDVSRTSMLGWLYLTIAGTVVAFAAYIWLLKKVSPTLVASYTFVNPIIAVLLGWMVQGERPTAWTIAGGLLVVTSVGGLLTARGNAQDRKRSVDEVQRGSLRERPTRDRVNCTTA
jgi:drug/metabolite transporter (DMT)-like permease